MTPEERHNHLLRFRRFQQSREKYFAPKINAELNKQYQKVIDHIHLGANAVHQISSTGITSVIRNIYIDAATGYGAKIRADLNRQGLIKSTPFAMELKRGAIGFSERMHQLIIDYFHTDILNISEGITNKTKELIIKVFSNAYTLGLGINDIVDKLKNTELSVERARTIARTETTTAANQGGFFVAKDTGLLLNKTWLATKDNRTRDDHKSHIGVDGHTVGRDDYFIVGGYEMLHPGDRGGHDGKPLVNPKETVNCRCTTTYSAVRDSSGRLIRA